jgi:hypothetical protein
MTLSTLPPANRLESAIKPLPGQIIAPSQVILIEPKSPAKTSVDPLAYYAANVALEAIASTLDRGEHYRIGGHFCRTLDQVVNALLEVTL